MRRGTGFGEVRVANPGVAIRERRRMREDEDRSITDVLLLGI